MSAPRILVVDSEADHREQLAAQLRARGFEVVAFGTTSEIGALRPFDLPPVAILDDDGGAATRGLIERGVVAFGMSSVLTGQWNRDYAIDRDRVAEYWDKPVPVEALEAWLRRLQVVQDRSTPVGGIDPARSLEVPSSPSLELELEPELELAEATPAPVVPAAAAYTAPAVQVAPATSHDDVTVEGPRVPRRLDPRLVQDAGDLNDVAFPTLLASLAYRRGTGALMLQLGEDKRLIYFVDGFAVSARTNREEVLSIADVALRSGLISAAQHHTAVTRGGATHAGVARVLVESGAMLPDDIDQLASAELRNRLLDVFEWERGQFAFREGAVPDHMMRDPLVSPMDLIWQGVQHGTPFAQVRSELERELGTPFVWLNEPPTADDMELTRSQQRVLGLLDGRRSLHDLSREGVVNEDVQRFLFLLVATGFLGWE